MFSITYADGTNRQVDITKFAAMDGWLIQQRFVEFAASRDQEFRRAFTLEVLAYATVKVGDNDMPLSTDALIDNHLRSWENVKAVFDEILNVNGIDPNTHAMQTEFWEEAGEKIAMALTATMSKMFEIANVFPANQQGK